MTLNIWKRGGGFQSGGSNAPLYNESNVTAANDVVLVSIEYRTNIFGFMNFASIDSAFSDSGTLGLKDQVTALK